MWDLIVSVPDHCLSFYFVEMFITLASIFYCRLSCAFVGMATYSFLRFIMGKVKIGFYFYLTADILTKVFQKCSLSSPLPNI